VFFTLYHVLPCVLGFTYREQLVGPICGVLPTTFILQDYIKRLIYRPGQTLRYF